jgi:hypothetical protein
MLSSGLAFRVVEQDPFMRSPYRCNCDECRDADTVLQELDRTAPPRIAIREREIMSALE